MSPDSGVIYVSLPSWYRHCWLALLTTNQMPYTILLNGPFYGRKRCQDNPVTFENQMSVSHFNKFLIFH